MMICFHKNPMRLSRLDYVSQFLLRLADLARECGQKRSGPLPALAHKNFTCDPCFLLHPPVAAGDDDRVTRWEVPESLKDWRWGQVAPPTPLDFV